VLYIPIMEDVKRGLVIVIFRNTNSWNSYSCMSLERLANLFFQFLREL
jgi:hypothetical protein